jgi:hypothetical protein
MTEQLRRWADSLESLPPIRLRKVLEVVGEQDRHIGPRWESARVTFRLEPHDGLDLRITTSSKLERMEELLFLTEAAYGLLDVLLTQPSGPIRDISIVIIDAESSETDSSKHAFRMAGRNAGRKVLEELGRNI